MSLRIRDNTQTPSPFLGEGNGPSHFLDIRNIVYDKLCVLADSVPPPPHFLDWIFAIMTDWTKAYVDFSEKNMLTSLSREQQ